LLSQQLQVLKIFLPKTLEPFLSNSLFVKPSLNGDQIVIFFLIPNLIPSNSPSLRANSIFFVKLGLQSNALECLQASVKTKKITYIKIVVSSKTEVESMNELLEKIFNIISKEDISGFIIQPTYGISEPSLEKLLKLYDLVYPFYKEVRVVPQLHKLIGAP